MQSEILACREECSLPEELHEGGGQEVVASRNGTSKNVGSKCSGDGSQKVFLLRRQMAAAAAGKKSATSLSLCMETFGLEVEEDLYSRHPDLGRRSMDRRMASRTKRSMVESDSRGPDVETGERTCRSGDVRDP